MKKGISLGFFNEDTSLLGISYDRQNFCDEITTDKKLVINAYHSISIGIIFMKITITF
jgi:hypothetical protein